MDRPQAKGLVFDRGAAAERCIHCSAEALSSWDSEISAVLSLPQLHVLSYLDFKRNNTLLGTHVAACGKQALPKEMLVVEPPINERLIPGLLRVSSCGPVYAVRGWRRRR
jgi:hypothetical protein